MLKSLLTDLAKEVGRSGATVLKQLELWHKSSKTGLVFRTNEELSKDLDGLYSASTIQRAKKKLLECGYIEVSFNKGLNRVTHYKLTKKALDLIKGVLSHSDGTLNNKGIDVPVKENTGVVGFSTTKKQQVVSTGNGLSETEEMKKSFEEGFIGSKNAIPVPLEALEAMKGLLKKKDDFSDEEDSFVVDFSNFTDHIENTKNVSKNGEKVSGGDLKSLIKGAYEKATNYGQDMLYNLKLQQQNFKEDF